MKIYRQRYKHKGIMKKTNNHYLGFGLDGKYIRFPAFKDYGATQALANRIEYLINLREQGCKPDEQYLQELARLPLKVQQKLMKLGLTGNKVVVTKDLGGLIEAWQKTLVGSAKYITEAPARVTRICRECDFREFQDITLGAVQGWRNEKLADGMARETLNTYVRNIKTFCRWMVKTGKAIKSPVEFLETLNPRIDQKRKRRALSITEQRALLTAAKNGLLVNGMTGADRCMLYWVALETGLRWSELYSLKIDSFNLDEVPSFIVVAANTSKHKREDIVPLRKSIAMELKVYFADRDQRESAFPNMWRDKGADMVRTDLQAAGIPFKNLDGIVDFHALRHTFLTNLAANGVHPKLAQALGRHASITQTLDRYTHTVLKSLAAALETLPSLSEEE